MIKSTALLQIRDTTAILYYRHEGLEIDRDAMASRMTKARDKRYSGKMTAGAKKRMLKAITLMCQAIKPKWIHNEVTGKYQFHRFSFITLTVSNDKNLTAREGYHLLLKHFLQWLRRTKEVTTYMWKAEFQERGQLHYHLIIPDFIHYREIRDKWNTLQREAGLLDEYAKEHKHYDPNSTDIHETRTVTKTANYIVKEIGKVANAKRLKAKKIVESLIKAGEIPAEQKKQFIDEYTGEDLATEGKLWDCSDNLSAAGYFTVPLSIHHQTVMTGFETWEQLREVEGDFWTIYVFENGKSPPDILTDAEKKQFDTHMARILKDEEEDPFAAIPDYCVADDVDREQSYSWEQLQLCLN